MSLKKFSIKGMHCKSCKMLVEDIMDDLNVEVKSLDVDEGNQIGTLTVDTDLSSEKIIEALKDETEYEAKEL